MFVRDRVAGSTRLVSRGTGNTRTPSRQPWQTPSLSADGRVVVAFATTSNDLAPGANRLTDRRLHERARHRLHRARQRSDGQRSRRTPTSSARRHVERRPLRRPRHRSSSSIRSGRAAYTGSFVRDRLTDVTERIDLDTGGDASTSAPLPGHVPRRPRLRVPGRLASAAPLPPAARPERDRERPHRRRRPERPRARGRRHERRAARNRDADAPLPRGSGRGRARRGPRSCARVVAARRRRCRTVRRRRRRAGRRPERRRGRGRIASSHARGPAGAAQNFWARGDAPSSIADTVLAGATFVAAIDDGGVVQSHAPSGGGWTLDGTSGERAQGVRRRVSRSSRPRRRRASTSTTTATSSSACSSSTTPRPTTVVNTHQSARELRVQCGPWWPFALRTRRTLDPERRPRAICRPGSARRFAATDVVQAYDLTRTRVPQQRATGRLRREQPSAATPVPARKRAILRQPCRVQGTTVKFLTYECATSAATSSTAARWPALISAATRGRVRRRRRDPAARDQVAEDARAGRLHRTQVRRSDRRAVHERVRDFDRPVPRDAQPPAAGRTSTAAAARFCDAGTVQARSTTCTIDADCPPRHHRATSARRGPIVPAEPDSDADGVPDHTDDCPSVANPVADRRRRRRDRRRVRPGDLRRRDATVRRGCATAATPASAAGPCVQCRCTVCGTDGSRSGGEGHRDDAGTGLGSWSPR